MRFSAEDINRVIDFEERPLSYSSIKHLIKSPLHFVHNRLEPFKGSEATIKGNIIHTKVLEPKEFDKKYLVWDDSKLTEDIGGARPTSTNRYKEEKQNQIAKAQESKRLMVMKSMVDECDIIVNAVLENPKAKFWIDRITEAEKPITWKQKGIKMRGHVDFVGTHKDEHGEVFFIGDLKTCQDASEFAFQSDAFKLAYHIQCGMYLDYYKRKHFKFPEFLYICVETKAPYGVNVFRASDQFRENGKAELDRLLTEIIYLRRQENRELWNASYDFRMADMPYNSLSLPGWAAKRIED